MALIYRNGRPRLQRSVRRCGRVTSEYGGTGEVALLIARMESIEREDRDEKRRREREERHRRDDIDREVDRLAVWGRALAREALTAAGFHQHKRGEWRRNRRKALMGTDIVVKPIMSTYGMTRMVRDMLIEQALGRQGEGEAKDRLRRELNELAAGFAGPDPTSVETALAETAAFCWFALRTYEGLLAASSGSKELTIILSEHHQRRIDRAHRRLMLTLKTLATVRKLAPPAIQVNVNLAHQQVNVAGSTS